MAVVLFTALALAVVYDLRERRIPNAVTASAALLALALGGLEPARLAAGAAAGAFLGVPALVCPDGMGLGDAKLAGVMGLALGPPVAVAILVACGAGTAYGLVARAATLPFAPFLALGALAVSL